MKTFLLTLAALTAFAPATLADPAPAAKSAALFCPVTGENIPSPAAAAGHETYKGKTYYFCCSACQPIFDKNPEKVLAGATRGKAGTP